MSERERGFCVCLCVLMSSYVAAAVNGAASGEIQLDRKTVLMEDPDTEVDPEVLILRRWCCKHPPSVAPSGTRAGGC